MSVVSVHRPTIWMDMSVLIKDRFNLFKTNSHAHPLIYMRGIMKKMSLLPKTVRIIMYIIGRIMG